MTASERLDAQRRAVIDRVNLSYESLQPRRDERVRLLTGSTACCAMLPTPSVQRLLVWRYRLVAYTIRAMTIRANHRAARVSRPPITSLPPPPIRQALDPTRHWRTLSRSCRDACRSASRERAPVSGRRLICSSRRHGTRLVGPDRSLGPSLALPWRWHWRCCWPAGAGATLTTHLSPSPDPHQRPHPSPRALSPRPHLHPKPSALTLARWCACQTGAC